MVTVSSVFKKVRDFLAEKVEEAKPFWEIVKRKFRVLKRRGKYRYFQCKRGLKSLAENERFRWYSRQLSPLLIWNGTAIAYVSHVFFGTSFDALHILAFGFVYYYGKIELFDRAVSARKNIKLNGNVKVDN